MTVDAQLEIQSGWAGGRRADVADDLAAIDACALCDCNIEQIAIQAEGLRSVIHDDEVAESGERVGERDDAVVDRHAGVPSSARDLDTV